VLICALLGIAFGPVTQTLGGQQAVGCQTAACKQAPNAQRWVSPLSGTWAVGSGLTGTFPASGQAYVAVGDGVAVIADGLTITAYAEANGATLWQSTLGGFKPGSAVMSLRAWSGVTTAGVISPSGTSRTEVVIDNMTGVVLRQYPSALFGGAVAASATTATVIGPSSVTSYDNGTGRVRWRHPADPGQAWRADGGALYLTESSGGYLHGGRVTALRVITLSSGSERTLGSPPKNPFTGSLAEVVSGVVVFTSASGVTAYDGSTGWQLWSMRGVVPEGTDPGEGLAYFTSGTGTLLGVEPWTGQVTKSVSGAVAPGPAGMYAVRGGVALGLDSGSGGEAWGYSLTAGRVAWTVSGLPWPHYFADVSGIGGSAARDGDIVIIAACRRLAPAQPAPTVTPTPTQTQTQAPATVPSPSGGATAAGSRPASIAPSSQVATSAPAPSATPSATPAPAPSPQQMCAAPVLVALKV
jgi:hypothetical protein